MVGYSEVLQTMAAMVLFSFILMTSNRMIHLNNIKEVESEVEKAAIVLAQTLIDEARVKAFDGETVGKIPSDIPSNFTICGPNTGENSRDKFDDFDDYHGWTENIDTALGENFFDMNVGVHYVSAPGYHFDDGDTTTLSESKKMRLTVTSPFHTDNTGQPIPITLEYLRHYYKG